MFGIAMYIDKLPSHITKARRHDSSGNIRFYFTDTRQIKCGCDGGICLLDLALGLMWCFNPNNIFGHTHKTEFGS